MAKIIPLYIMEKEEKYGVENPHDKLFKDLLDDEEELKSFILEFVGINIQNEEVEKCNNEYITNQYQLYESDMVYKIKGKNVYFLIEHQSTVDINMPYRILNYYLETLKMVMNSSKVNKYPLIIPIVLYTGDKSWRVETEYNKRIEKYTIEEKYIKMKYELVNINQYTEEELLEKNTLLSYAMLLEKNRGKASLMSILNKISARCDTNKNREKMQRIINYILYPILEEDTEKMIKKFNIKEEFSMKTAQDYIREEIRELKRKAQEEGMKEGIKEGIEEGQRRINSIVINMIKNNVKVKEIEKYTGINEKEIKKIAANM